MSHILLCTTLIIKIVLLIRVASRRHLMISSTPADREGIFRWRVRITYCGAGGWLGGAREVVGWCLLCFFCVCGLHMVVSRSFSLSTFFLPFYIRAWYLHWLLFCPPIVILCLHKVFALTKLRKNHGKSQVLGRHNLGKRGHFVPLSYVKPVCVSPYSALCIIPRE